MRNLPALNPLFFHTASSQPWKARIVESESPVVMENGTTYSTWACRVSPKVFQRLQRSKLVHKWLVWKVRSSRCYSRDGVLTVLWWCSYLVWLLSRHSIPPCALVFNWKLSHLYKRTLSYATTYACVAVPGRNRTLFCCVFRAHYHIRSALMQYFRYRRGSYVLGKLINAWRVYTVRMGPAPNESSALQRFERGNALEIRNGIMFDFYPGLPHIINDSLFQVFVLRWGVRWCVACWMWTGLNPAS